MADLTVRELIEQLEEIHQLDRSLLVRGVEFVRIACADNEYVHGGRHVVLSDAKFGTKRGDPGYDAAWDEGYEACRDDVMMAMK